MIDEDDEIIYTVEYRDERGEWHAVQLATWATDEDAVDHAKELGAEHARTAFRVVDRRDRVVWPPPPRE